MNDVLVRQLARALDQRLLVFRTCIADGSILEKDMERQSAVFLMTEILRPCCCMVCNIGKLESILVAAELFKGNDSVVKALAKDIYTELARMNGLG